MKRLSLMRSLLTLLVGFVVLHTATAQTSTDPNEGSRLTRGSALGSYDFSWWGQPGRTYFFQHSDDLSTWEYLPLIESGTNGLLSWSFTSTAGKFFLRLRTADIPTSNPFNADFDGDKVGNWDELMQGTDPLSAADTDANGLPDDWEKFYFGHIGIDPNAEAPGGGMTNLQHFQLGSNPNNAPPPPIIIAGTATLDLNADTPIYPATTNFAAAGNGGNLITNGDFSLPPLSDPWSLYDGGIPGWTAISGSLIELQQIWPNTAASAGQYCELDSHWRDGQSESDHGIQQAVDLPRGRYVLIFDYSGRQPGADSFTVNAQVGYTSPATLPVQLVAKNGAAMTWQRAIVTFEVTGGNPSMATVPVTLLFDIADAPDSYGAFIDNVILSPVPLFDSTDYSRGFDPLTEPSWTSVCQETVPIGPGDDLNVNKHIIVRFADDATALRYEILLADGDDAKVDLEIDGGMKKETHLKITGKDDLGPDPEPATVNVYLKADTGTPRHPIATPKLTCSRR